LRSRRARIVVVLALATVLGTSAIAWGGLIRINIGIRGVQLDMRRNEVRDVRGRPSRVVRGMNDFGRFIVFRYPRGLRVIFQGGAGVTAVTTTNSGDKTRAGVGPGSSARKVRRNVPGVSCETFSGFRHCHVGEFNPGERITDFFIRRGQVTRVVVGYVID
jgi:hypothetical protein